MSQFTKQFESSLPQIFRFSQRQIKQTSQATSCGQRPSRRWQRGQSLFWWLLINSVCMNDSKRERKSTLAALVRPFSCLLTCPWIQCSLHSFDSLFSGSRWIMTPFPLRYWASFSPCLIRLHRNFWLCDRCQYWGKQSHLTCFDFGHSMGDVLNWTFFSEPKVTMGLWKLKVRVLVSHDGDDCVLWVL